MFRIDTRSSKPIYEQLIDLVKQNIVRGFLHPGDELLSVRKMAIELSVTPNTVAKAYRELERQGVIEVIRGKGAYISGDYEPKWDAEKLNAVKESMKLQCIELLYMGWTEEEILQWIKKLLQEVKDIKGEGI